MPGSIIRGRTIFSSAGGGGTGTLDTRVTTLENVTNKVSYFYSIAAGTTGTITIPSGATIILDELYSGADAYLDTIVNGQPTGKSPFTAGGVAVDVTSFDALGNYTLNGTPSAYPVALIYQLSIKEKDKGNLTEANILDIEDQNAMPYLTGTAGKYIRTNGLGAAPIVSTLGLPNAATSGIIVIATGTDTYGETSALTWSSSNGIVVTQSSANYGFSYVRSAGGETWRLNIDGGDYLRLSNSATGNVDIFYRKGFPGIGIGVTGLSQASLYIQAETATAGTQPIKFVTPATLATAASQTFGNATSGDNLYFVIATGTARKNIVMDDGTLLTSGRIPAATTNGRLIDGPTPAADGTTSPVTSITISKGIITAIS